MIDVTVGGIAYDEDSPTGLRWLVNASTRARAGSPAGSDFQGRYWRIRYKGMDDLAHRVVYRLAIGPIPHGLHVDHIDGNGKNNRAENLRLVSAGINQRNRRMSRLNKTGVTGVHYVDRYDGFEAKVTTDGGSKTKFFSSRTYGDRALSLAAEWRASMIESMNMNGAGYSQGHGLRRVLG